MDQNTGNHDLSPWKETCRAILVLLVLNIIFFSGFLLRGRHFFQFGTLRLDSLFQQSPMESITNFEMADLPVLIYPPMKFYNDMRHRGKLYFWNSMLLCGYPFAAYFDFPYFFYPLSMLAHQFLGALDAISLIVFIHFLIAGIGMYFLAKTYGFSWRASLFTSIAWMFSGQATTWLEYGFISGIYAYMPLLFLAFRLSLQKNSPGWSAAGAAALALSILSGYAHPNYNLVLFFLLYLIFTAFTLRGHWYRVAAPAAIILGGAFCLAAPHILTMAEVALLSQRRAFEFSELVSQYTAPLYSYLLRIIAPDLLGNPALGLHIHLRGTTFYHESCIYAGILPLALALFGIRNWKKEEWFLAGSALFCITAAACTFIYYPFFTLFPMFNKILPNRVLLIFFFSMALLSGQGFARFERETKNPRALQMILLAMTIFFVLIFLGTLFFQHHMEAFLPLLKTLLPVSQISPEFESGATFPMRFAGMVSRYYAPGNVFLYIQGIFALLALLILLGEHLGRIRKDLAIWLLIALNVVDLMSFGLKFLPTTALSAPPEPAFVRTLKTRIPWGNARLLRLDAGGLPDTLTIYEIEEATGQKTAFSTNYAAVMGELESSFDKKNRIIFGSRVYLRSYKSPILDMLNVRFILTHPDPLPPDPDLVLVEKQGDQFLYEKKSACSRVYFTGGFNVADVNAIKQQILSPLFDPQKLSHIEEQPVFPAEGPSPEGDAVKIISMNPDRLEIDVNAACPGILVYSDMYFRGWHVIVDGRESALLRVNAMLKGAAISPGAHRVCFYYRNPLIGAGITLQCLAVVVLLLLATLALRLRRISGRVKEEAAQ